MESIQESTQDLCVFCHKEPRLDNWKICQTCRDGLSSAPQVHICLMNSSTHDYGIVYWWHNSIGFSPIDGTEIPIGIWGTYGKGEIWVSLIKPPDALHDYLTQLYEAEFEERKKLPTTSVPKRKSKTSAPRTKAAPIVRPEESIFADIRNRLKASSSESSESSDED